MSTVKSSIVFIFILAVTGISAACSSAHWVNRSRVSGEEYYIFDNTSATGTGLKLESLNYQPRRCIRSSDTYSTGGMLGIEFLNPAAVLSGESGPFRDFVRIALNRASAYNVTGMKPVSVACVVTVTGRMNYLADNSIQLTELAESFLKRGDIDGFYRHCGTRFIDSTLFESGFAFVVTYYMPPEEAERISSRIKYGRGTGTSDISNFSIFDEAGSRYPAFFSSSGSTDNVFIPVEFPLVPYNGELSISFLKRALQSCLASSSGKIISFNLKKWGELPGINRYMPLRTGDRYPEEAHDQIEALAQDMRDFSLFRINLGKITERKNQEIIDRLKRNISWGNFYKCSWGISSNAYLNPDKENDCKDLMQGLRSFREVENYNPFISGLEENARLNSDCYRELRLIDASTLKGDEGVIDSEYRFDDSTLLGDIPDMVVPGQTMDASGKTYSSDCIMKGSMSFISNKGGAVNSIRSDCYPVGSDDWGVVKRTLLFWKQSPYMKPRYRGNLEITGFSDELSDSFTITGEAVELARKDLTKFYKKYGTHYVSQVKGRRGIVYYFSADPERDKSVSLDHYGLSLSYLENNEPGGTNLPDVDAGGCMSPLSGLLFNRKKEEPLLHPETVSGFFRTRNDFVRVFRGGEQSIPVEVYLKPWSQYLLERGIIRIDQTVPVTLFQDHSRDAVEGKVAITCSNGDFYEGELNNGLRNGYGELKSSDGSFYKGGWMGDLMHGRGVYISNDGSSYNGDFMYGYPHGTGEHKDAKGNIYKGGFYKGRITGHGDMQYNDGRKYRGSFSNGEPEGFGIMEYPDGRKVEGTFSKGKYFRKK